MTEFAEIGEALVRLARDAGALLLKARAAGFDVRRKADASPVTSADIACEAMLVERLQRLWPTLPVVTEESAASWCIAPTVARVLCIDPLDGTREFVDGRDEFAINLALIEDGVPVVGVVAAPALDRLFLAAGPGAAFEERGGARRAITAADGTGEGLTVVASRSHLDAATAVLIDRLRPARLTRIGSAVKFGLIAAGEADLYPRGVGVKAWDVAAGQAVVTAAGGVLVGFDGAPVRFDVARGVEAPPFLCARTARIAEAARQVAA